MAGDQDAIALAERVLGILDEGSFSATYKFALFTAILDLCIEKTTRGGAPPTSLTTRELAQKVVELYWNHAVPYRTVGTLRQGGGRSGNQAEILRRIEEFRSRWGGAQSDTLYRTRLARPVEFARLLEFVEWKLIKMPIPRLQVLGWQEDRFLYEYNWTQTIRKSTVTTYQHANTGFDNCLRLKRGVAESLTRLNGVLRPLFYRQWAVMVARMNGLPEAELEAFLFGSERTPLDAVRDPLRNLQDNRCFYCDDRLTGRVEVDHFIPWSRHPDDGLDNLVAAHPRCNSSKRDFLAAAEHVEHWAERTRAHDRQLAEVAGNVGWHRDADCSASVATAIYLRLPATARLWRRPDEFVVIERDRIARALAG
jgi:5-methylcytosine-specific restriction endonuclease McrA